MQSDQPNSTTWWWGMSAPDLVVHFVREQGPLTAGQIAKQVPSDFPMVASPRRYVGEGIKRAMAKGTLVHTAKGYDLRERANG